MKVDYRPAVVLVGMIFSKGVLNANLSMSMSMSMFGVSPFCRRQQRVSTYALTS